MKRLYADDKLICEDPDTGTITISAKDIDLQPSVIDSWSITSNRPITGHLNVDAFPFEPQSNCRNCGAPLNRNKDCDYCGTKHQMKSGIFMNATNIGFFVG